MFFGKYFFFSYWNPNEPNNLVNENCVEIKYYDLENSWNDENCEVSHFWISLCSCASKPTRQKDAFFSFSTFLTSSKVVLISHCSRIFVIEVSLKKSTHDGVMNLSLLLSTRQHGEEHTVVLPSNNQFQLLYCNPVEI